MVALIKRNIIFIIGQFLGQNLYNYQIAGPVHKEYDAGRFIWILIRYLPRETWL